MSVRQGPDHSQAATHLLLRSLQVQLRPLPRTRPTSSSDKPQVHISSQFQKCCYRQLLRPQKRLELASQSSHFQGPHQHHTPQRDGGSRKQLVLCSFLATLVATSTSSLKPGVGQTPALDLEVGKG